MSTHAMTVGQWQFLVGCVWYERLIQTVVLVAVTYVWEYGVAMGASFMALLRQRWMMIA